MLTSLLKSRITVVWLALTTATITSWLLGVGHGLSDNFAGVTIMLIAFTKVHFVGRYFMELRDAPVTAVGIFEGWVAIVAVALVGLFLLA